MTVVTFSTNLIELFAIGAGLLFLIAIALLSPVLVRLAELLVRLPLLLVSGVGGRLALADIRRRPRRMAGAVCAVALGASFVGVNYLIDVTLTHGAVVQGGQRLVADAAVSAPGAGTGSRGAAGDRLPAGRHCRGGADADDRLRALPGQRIGRWPRRSPPVRSAQC